MGWLAGEAQIQSLPKSGFKESFGGFVITEKFKNSTTNIVIEVGVGCLDLSGWKPNFCGSNKILLEETQQHLIILSKQRQRSLHENPI